MTTTKTLAGDVINTIEIKLLKSRNLENDIRDGFARIREALGNRSYVSPEVLDGLEFLVEDTPDVELRSALRNAIRRLRVSDAKTSTDTIDVFRADELPAETARRLRSLV